MFKRNMLSFLLTLFLINQILSQSVKKIELNSIDFYGGTYYIVEPETVPIEGVLILLAGFGQRAEETFPETKLHNVAYMNNILTVGFAAGNKLYADSLTVEKLNRVIYHLQSTYKIPSDKFVIGGFSAGGMIALKYTQLCKEFPDRFPIQPAGVFMVDAPIDIFTIWKNLEESFKNKYSHYAVEEAERAMNHIKNEYGIPSEHVTTYVKLNPFNMDISLGQPEIHLKNTAVRAYHDVDISWRLINRNQTVHNSNYEVTAELINRLLLMGNHKAEFMQSFQTGYRANGNRHPHSWSIVNEVECIQWIKKLFAELR